MHVTSPFAERIVFTVGPLAVSGAVVTTWALMVALVLVSWLGTRRLSETPGLLQGALELLVEGIEDQLREITLRDPAPLVPLLGTLFLYLATANLSSVLPGVESPTARIETPAALALVVFASVHVFGVRAHGVRRYLRRYLRPTPLLLPLNVLAEITRTFALMIRLFGNIMSHGLVVAIVVSIAGLLVPVPLMILGVLIGLVQAYIFTVLAAVFVGAAVEKSQPGAV